MFDQFIKKITSNRFFKKIAWGCLAVIVLILLVLGLRSCSGNNVIKKDVYRIGRASTWYSLPLYGREKKFVAFTNDLIAMIGSENKIRFEWIEANSQTILDGLEVENYDFILSPMRPNIVNEDHYNFSELLFELGPVLIVRQNEDISSLEEMNGRHIGVLSGYSPMFNAIRSAGANDFDLIFVSYDTMNRALDSLVNDQIDGVILNAISAYTMTHGLYAGKVKVVTPPLNDEGIRIVSLVKSSLDDIIDDINISLNKMRINGTYSALIAKWDLVDPETDYWHAPVKEKKDNAIKK